MNMEKIFFTWNKETDEITGTSDLSEAFENTGERTVDLKRFGKSKFDATVSMVFLCIDRSFSDSDKPVLFETIVFLFGDAIIMQRYTTSSDARYGHMAMVDYMREEILPELRRLSSTRRIKKWMKDKEDMIHLNPNERRKQIPGLVKSLKERRADEN